ncbi:MAG: pilus assembly protein PilM [Candidatus Roizmanbacteria bacterium]|nr:pilus assembly protein PilM [Candidatus Roizmanbacteria bacterium]
MVKADKNPKKKRVRVAKRYPCFLFTEQAVFLVQVNSTGDQFTVFRETVLPKGLIAGGAVQDQKQLSLFLSQMAKQSKLKETEIMVGLPELKATTQSITLPQMVSEEVTQAIENKASSILPFPYDEAYVDWQFIDKPKEGDMTILISAMPRSVVDGFVATFEAAGLTPLAFETTATSLLRLIPPESAQPVAAVDYTGTNATLIITQKGAIVASSVLQDGADIVEKVHRMIEYYLSQQEGESAAIGSVYLTGKNISPQFVTSLSQLLKVEAKLLSAGITNIARERQSELAILSSLSRKTPSLPEDEKTINLLPDEKALLIEEEQMRKKEQQRKIGAVMLLVIFLIMSSVSFITLRNKTENLRQEIEAFSTKQHQSLTFNPTQISLIDTTAVENEKLSNLMTILFDEAPQGILLSGIQFDTETGQVLLSGRASDRNTLLLYRDALEKREEISEVTIPLSSLEHEIDVEFRMQITL